MKLSVNGEAKNVNATTLEELAVAEFGYSNGIAIAVNDKIIPKSKWASLSLQNNDIILAVQATQGG